MAIVHSAFSLDLDAFNQLLAQRVAVDGRLQPDLLYELALERLASWTADMDYALGSLRFSERWLDTEEGDEYEWFWIVLASVLTPIVSMSSRIVFGHSFVRQLLETLDEWSPTEISYLLRGNENYSESLIQPFKYIVGNYEGPPIPHAHGMGWLKMRDVRRLMDKLILTALRVTTVETESIVAHYTQFNNENFTMSHELIMAVVDDAIQMLGTAIVRRQDMFLMVTS